MQFGVWLTTWHSALGAHTPGQGSLHFSLIQAKWLGHSLFVIHSGRQFGGAPMYPGKHEHEGESPTVRQIAFGPQGEGWHGLTRSTGTSCAEKKTDYKKKKLG